MKKNKVKLINDEAKNEVIKPDKEESKEKPKRGRPTLLTPELFTKLIKLFEKHFFIAIVASSSDIYQTRIYEWMKEQEEFRNAVTHAQDKWIKNEMKELDNYAIDKRTKDWRAKKWKLSVARMEFNDKKYLRETTSKRDATNITIILNRKDLESSRMEATEIIGEGKIEEETISLIPFEEKKKLKEHKLTRREKIEKAQSE